MDGVHFEGGTLLDRSILDQMANLSVELNGVIIPGRSIENVFAQYCVNLCMANDDELYKVSLAGSATPVRYQGREILLTTQHQLKGFDNQQVSMLTDTGNLITSGGCRSYNGNSDSDAYDICAFDFTEPCKDHPELRNKFFNFREVPPDALNVHIIGILLSGYPSADQKYEIHEANHLGLARRQIVCFPEAQPTDPALLTVKAERSLRQQPDGMSGGSAFIIQFESGKPKAYFAGIILRGGTDSFHILKAGFVMVFLKSVFS